MDFLKQAHIDTDIIIEKIEAELDFDYNATTEQINKIFTEFFRKYGKIYEKKAQELENGTITQKQYSDFMIKNVFLSKDWKSIKEELANFYVKINQQELNLINEKMAKVYAVNYNAMQKAIQKEVI